MLTKKNRKNQKGQALVESALTVLAFLMMLLAILDFGQFLYFQQSLAERTQDLGSPEGRVTVTISGFPISMVAPGLKNILRSPTTSVTYPSEAPW